MVWSYGWIILDTRTIKLGSISSSTNNKLFINNFWTIHVIGTSNHNLATVNDIMSCNCSCSCEKGIIMLRNSTYVYYAGYSTN
jgi:hypothetical protein